MTIHNLICPFFLVKFQSEDELGLSCEGSENARQIELEQRILETRLRQQQLQSEEDSKWLLKEENNLKKRLSITASVGSDDLTGKSMVFIFTRYVFYTLYAPFILTSLATKLF